MHLPVGDLYAHSKVSSLQVFGPTPRTKVLLSIVIPTYRRGDLLQQAVISALEQDGFENYEIIIIDNDPEGELPLWIHGVSKKYSHTYLYYFKNEKNLGMTGNWNRGIELSCGEWISFLHDDDWLSPNFLKKMIDSIPENAKALACRSDRGVLPYDRGHVFKTCFHVRNIVEVSPCRIVAGNLVDAPGIVYRKSELINLGGYLNSFYPSSDYYLNTRLVLDGGVYILFEKLAYYRISDSLTFKGGTLESIMAQSHKIRRFILENDHHMITRFNCLTSSLWWYRLGVNREFDVDRVFGVDPLLRFLARVPGLTHFFRFIVNIILTWK